MTPIRSRRPASLLAVLTAAILLGGCSSEDAAETGASGSAAAGVTSPGAPAGSTEAVGAPTTDVTSTPPPAEPQDVATDPDPEPSSGSDTGGVVPDVEVVTSYAGWDATSGDVAAAGYVTGVVEDGGTCTLTLSRSGQEVVVEAPGLADASTTACGGLEVAGTALAPGQWSAVLAYRSDAASATAEPVRVDNPGRAAS